MTSFTSIKLDTLLKAQDAGKLCKVFRTYVGNQLTAEYKANQELSVGGDCLYISYIYEGDRLIGQNCAVTTWSQEMQDGVNAVSDPFTSLYCVSFDGVDEYVTIPHNADVNFERTKAFTVSVWFKTSGTLAKKLVSKQDTGTTLRGWFMGLSTTATPRILFYLYNDNATSNRRIFQSPLLAVSDGLWHHAVCAFSGDAASATGVVMYIDGQAQVLSAASGTISATMQNTQDIRIGTDSALTEIFSGRIDEVSIWDRQLSQSEVQQIYNDGAPTNLANHSGYSSLITWYRMGDGDTYPTLVDHGSLGYAQLDATMVNMSAENIKLDSPT